MYVSIQMTTKVSYQQVTTDLVIVLVFDNQVQYIQLPFPSFSPYHPSIPSSNCEIPSIFIFSLSHNVHSSSSQEWGLLLCRSATSGHMIRINSLHSSNCQKPIGGISCPCKCTCKDYIWLGLEQALCMLS